MIMSMIMTMMMMMMMMMMIILLYTYIYIYTLIYTYMHLPIPGVLLLKTARTPLPSSPVRAASEASNIIQSTGVTGTQFLEVLMGFKDLGVYGFMVFLCLRS